MFVEFCIVVFKPVALSCCTLPSDRPMLPTLLWVSIVHAAFRVVKLAEPMV